jgi:hypothetical protein
VRQEVEVAPVDHFHEPLDERARLPFHGCRGARRTRTATLEYALAIFSIAGSGMEPPHAPAPGGEPAGAEPSLKGWTLIIMPSFWPSVIPGLGMTGCPGASSIRNRRQIIEMTICISITPK